MRACIALFVFAACGVSGCSLPRGPINIDPYIPRWILHGDVSCECPPPAAIEGDIIDPNAIQPPLSKFHPVPTHPVFAPHAP
jgi:hypothetical protein